jgi:hypothetical protein
VKIGDVITCVGPHGTVVSGTVRSVEPMKTRPGWNVQIDPQDPTHYQAFGIRPEDEGHTWVYGDDAAKKNALEVAAAFLRPRLRHAPARRKKGSV